MASSYSTNLKLELITTGEKSGTWGTITNTNLQQLEQAASGYISVDVAGSDVALAISNGAVSNGKNLYYKLTGTLAANRTVTLPDSTERVVIIEDATTRGTAAQMYTVTLLTTGASAANQVPLPEGATVLVYSRGSVPSTSLGMMQKGFTTVTAASKTAYTAVNGDQIGVDTVANIVTITLPAGAVGDEIVIMDMSASNGFGTNKCVVAPNGSDDIQGNNTSIDLTTNNQSVTLIYTGSNKGWQLKTNTA